MRTDDGALARARRSFLRGFRKETGNFRSSQGHGHFSQDGRDFRQIGLLEHIYGGALSLEDRFLGIWARSLVGEEFGRVPITARHSEFTPCQPIHCPQTFTEKILLEALRNEPVASVHFNSEVASIENREDGAKLTLKDGKAVGAQWVVGADGAGSSVRKVLEIETEGPGDMGHFVNVMFRAPYRPAPPRSPRDSLSGAVGGVL